MQVRLGPMRVGPWGLLQPIADPIKLLLKEDIIPARADQWIFMLAPIICLIPAFIVFAVIPFGPAINILGKPVTLYITDLNIGVLYVLSISSVGVLGIILAGWASNSKYPLLGALRSAAQMVSYEVALGFSIIGVLMLAGIAEPGKHRRSAEECRCLVRLLSAGRFHPLLYLRCC